MKAERGWFLSYISAKIKNSDITYLPNKETGHKSVESLTLECRHLI